MKKGILVIWVLILSCIQGCGKTEQQPSFPCAAVGWTAQQQGYSQVPASLYAQNLILTASQLGGVSRPNSVYAVVGLNNAYYTPNNDSIAFDPIFLQSLNVYTGGGLEAGDSVLFHEVGHMWAYKTGISARIGYGSILQNHNQEFQGDSYAGYILKLLGGNFQPSVSVYSTIMAGWSQSHPPGAQRAQVFYDAWSSGQIHHFDVALAKQVEDSGGIAEQQMNSSQENINRLKKLLEIKEKIQQEGLNPFSSESDATFSMLDK